MRASRCASRPSVSSAGSSTAPRSTGCRCGSSGRRGASTVSSPAATSRPTTTPTRLGSASPSSSTGSSSLETRLSPQASPSVCSPASSSPIRAPSRSARSRCGSTRDRWPRHDRRLRLHRRALDRVRLRPGSQGDTGAAGRGGDLRRVVTGEVATEPLFDPKGEADQGLAPRYPRACSTSAVKSAASSPASGCQSTPSAKRFVGSSSASSVPSTAYAVGTSPSPRRPKP